MMREIHPQTIELIQSADPAIRPLMREFPPGCKVRARAGIDLLIPAPGRVGRVIRWSMADRAGIGIVHDDEADPTAGGFCRPEWLTVVEYMITPEEMSEIWAGGGHSSVTPWPA